MKELIDFLLTFLHLKKKEEKIISLSKNISIQESFSIKAQGFKKKSLLEAQSVNDLTSIKRRVFIETQEEKSFFSSSYIFYNSSKELIKRIFDEIPDSIPEFVGNISKYFATDFFDSQITKELGYITFSPSEVVVVINHLISLQLKGENRYLSIGSPHDGKYDVNIFYVRTKNGIISLDVEYRGPYEWMILPDYFNLIHSGDRWYNSYYGSAVRWLSANIFANSLSKK